MNRPVLLSATDRFAVVIGGLLKALVGRQSAGAITGPLLILISHRIIGFNHRVQALAAKIRAGTLRQWPVRQRRAPRPVPMAGVPRLPNGFAWLLRLVPSEAACYAGQMRVVLADPEMAALIAATPRMGRILRPMCRMLGIEADVLAPAVPPAGVPTADAIAPPGRAFADIAAADKMTSRESSPPRPARSGASSFTRFSARAG